MSLTLSEAKDLFTDETSWSHGCFQEQCAIHDIEPLEDEWFGLTALRLWEVLSDDEQEEFRESFADYYANEPLPEVGPLRARMALEKSILHWQENVAMAEEKQLPRIFAGDCALCDRYRNQDEECEGCPVRQRTGHAGCLRSPYVRVHRRWQQITRRQLEDQALSDRHWWDLLEACQAELEFLKSIREDDKHDQN